MCDLKLFPGYNSSRSNLVGLYFKSTVPIAEQMCLLREDSRKYANDCPAEETSVGRCVASIEERILLFGVTMDVTVDPNVTLLALSERFEELLDVVNLGVQFLVRINPLSVEVDARDRVPIVATDDAVWVQDRDEDEGVELAKELRLLSVGAKKVKDAFENSACGCLA